MSDMQHSVESKIWTDSELIRLYQARLNFIPYAVIAKQLGRSPNACEHQYRIREKWLPRLKLEVPAPVRAEAKDVEIRKLSERIDSRLELNRVRSDVLADRLADAIKPYPTITPPLYKLAKKKAERTPEDAGLMLSDLHIGHSFTLEETGGLAEYSLAVFHRRLDNLRKAVTEITELHSSLYRMPTINLFLLGDNTHGMSGVGKWSQAYIDLSIVDQVMYGVRSFADFVCYMLSLYENVTLHCVGGNHGRAAEKGAEKDYVNWDYITYKMLELYFRDNPRVKIVAPKSWFIFTEIRNHKFLLLHGEDVKGGDLPIRSLLKVEDKIIRMIKDMPHYTLAGHFHNVAEVATSSGRVMINGCFSGGDPHSLKSIQVGGRPEQVFFGIHDKRGVTWKYNIDLESQRD